MTENSTVQLAAGLHLRASVEAARERRCVLEKAATAAGVETWQAMATATEREWIEAADLYDMLLQQKRRGLGIVRSPECAPVHVTGFRN